MRKIIEKYPSVRFIAHRGIPSKILENTYESFLEAAKSPYFGIETDIHFTKDQVPILFHDTSLARLSNNTGLVSETNFDVIENLLLKNTYKIPLIHQYLNICSNYNKVAIIELKSKMTEDQILHIFKQIQANNYIDHTVIISFNAEDIIFVRKLYPNIEIHYLNSTFNDDILKTMIAYRFNLSLEQSQATQEILATVHSHHLKIGVWTVNTLEGIDKFAKMGMDYITTDGI